MPNDFFSLPFFHARPIFRIGFYSSRLYIFSVSVINTIQLWHCERYCFFLKQCFFILFHNDSEKIRDGTITKFLSHFSHPRAHLLCAKVYIEISIACNKRPSFLFFFFGLFFSFKTFFHRVHSIGS